MGYKDLDNNGNFVKMRGDEGEEDEPAQAPETHTLGQVMDVLADLQISLGNLNTRFDRMDERLNFWVLKWLIFVALWIWVLVQKRYVVILFNLHHQKQPTHHLMHDLHFILFAFIISVLVLSCLLPPFLS